MSSKRWAYLLLGGVGLILVYVFQAYLDAYSIFFQFKPPEVLNYSSDYKDVDPFSYSVNKLVRYLLNDLFAIAIIYGLFGERIYVRFAFYVMLFGLVVLLPLYLWLFFQHPDGYSSMLSHLHRVVLNPVLMMLLIPAFYYQKTQGGKTDIN
ncbi:MAG: exosortase F system-associated protein [Owenweeksia sp.]|nr:exosortase F system-associated protein [Owenweeksia sp.]MBG00303.1 exosortase F system-associated protein [Owenweeksia sp.]HBF20161.1 exosortase F system-associated protein [Cryomorphaceae bacterium]HCQ15728.1 exosortase F system-associated protein [Cryomorphaceae bacterium]|tara:strand:- start:1363 stop:1815 length:453 start_codon:yes stop_codon:yes gene_type:complete